MNTGWMLPTWGVVLSLSAQALGQSAAPTVAGSQSVQPNSEVQVAPTAPAEPLPPEVVPAQSLPRPPTSPSPSVPAAVSLPSQSQGSAMGKLEADALPPPEDPGPPVLLGGGKPAIGGYGGISVVGSSMKGQAVVYAGGEGALLLAHRLALGIGGYGLVSRIAGPEDLYGNSQRLSFGYGGLVVRYSLVDRRPYYLTVGALVGGGGAAYTRDWDEDDDYDHHYDTDSVVVLEPSVGAHLNLTRWARVGATVSYRFVSGIDELTQVKEKDLAGFAYGGNVQLGWF